MVEFMQTTRINSLTWTATSELEIEALGPVSKQLDGALGKDIKIIIKKL